MEPHTLTTTRSLAVRVFSATEKVLAFLNSGCGAVYHGLWLGLLSDQELRRITEDWYSRSSLYQDSAYDNSGLTPWELYAVERFFCSVRRVLIGACGGGREAIALAERGFEVDAFDCNPDLVECSQRMFGPATRVFYAVPDQVPEGIGNYDAFIMGWGAYSHILPRSSRIRFLQAIKAHLRPGAPVLISFMIRTEKGEIKFRLTRAIANFLRKLRFATGIELGDSISGTLDHHFNRVELESELRECGFNLSLYSEGFYAHAVATAGEDRATTVREAVSTAERT